MRQPDAWLVVGCCALLVACTGSEGSGEGPWHEPQPSITVNISAAADSSVVLDTVKSLPAPEIRFAALVEPDPSHFAPATAPATGLVVSVSRAREVRRGDTLAVVGQGSQPAGRLFAVLATQAGTWRPRREPRQLVWAGDTVGLIESHEYWWAVGSVSDVESRSIHRNDPAWVGTGTDKHSYRPGRVEWIERPGMQRQFSGEVAVEFRGHQPYGRGAPVTAIVAPAHPEDSVPAVPASAVVQLRDGPGVFLRLGPGLYELRWVTTGESQHGLVGVRGEIRRGALVVAGGLALLADAARDSLQRRAAKLYH